MNFADNSHVDEMESAVTNTFHATKVHSIPMIEAAESQLPVPEFVDSSDTSTTERYSSRRSATIVELDHALLRYMTNYGSRLLKAEQPSTYNNFLQANAENAIKYVDYTSAELRERFVEQILPKVFDFALSERETNMLQLLELHPDFDCVPEGFIRKPPAQRVCHNREPKQGVDYKLVAQDATSREQLFPPNSESAATELTLASQQPEQLRGQQQHHPILVLPQAYEKQGSGYNFRFSSANAAVISAALSIDFELSGCVLLEPKEMHQRLRHAKRNFEQHARMPENCSSGSKLIAKMQKLHQLRATFVDLMATRYLQNSE